MMRLEMCQLSELPTVTRASGRAPIGRIGWQGLAPSPALAKTSAGPAPVYAVHENAFAARHGLLEVPI